MGFSELRVTMQFPIAASLLVAGTTAQLITYPNGAVVPVDHANLAATNAHIANTGYGYYPYAGGFPHVFGKREAQLVHHANGAVTPYDPNVAIATANHFAAHAARGYYGYNHPALYGKREAQVPVNLVTGFAHVASPYFGYFGHHIAPVVAPFTAHPNGALVPKEPVEVEEARAEHLAAVAEA